MGLIMSIILLILFVDYVIPFILGLQPSMIQAIATIVLVIITSIYALQTKQHADLFRKELELENDRNHAEVLQKRIDDWLDNFPEVEETDVPIFQDREMPYAVPDPLQVDPYYEDLLENHADDIKPLLDDIDSKYDDFVRIREDYIDAQDIDHEYQNVHQLEPLARNYSIWLFQRILLLERTDATRRGLSMEVQSEFEDKYIESGNSYLLRCGVKGTNYRPILIYHFRRSISQSRADMDIMSIRLSSFPGIHINEIDTLPNYNEAVRAAEILDDIEEQVDKLHTKLLRYKDAPRFQGDCDLMYELDE